MKEKVVLAYSGGLDTTAIIPWLKEHFNYDVVCCCIDCGQGSELDGLEERAKLSGASKLYIEDLVDDFAENYIVPCVQANATYENKYLLGTSMARPAIAKRLVEIARQSLEVGLKEVKPWNFLGDMGSAIHDFVRENGYSVVREIGGHGIGLEFHEEPWVSYVSEKGTEMLMVPGMMFTIEPMINMGKPDVFVDEDDDWTVYTEDGLPSAQWEIQVLVTEDGYEIISY